MQESSGAAGTYWWEYMTYHLYIPAISPLLVISSSLPGTGTSGMEKTIFNPIGSLPYIFYAGF